MTKRTKDSRANKKSNAMVTSGSLRRTKKTRSLPGSHRQLSIGTNREVHVKKRSFTTDRDKPVTDTQKANFVDFLKETFATGVQAILDSYTQALKTYVPPNMTHVAFDQNLAKNRYKDVFCGDHARVILTDGHPNGNYIHANFLSGEPLINTFICTQGPMASTTVDFWRMIVQERVENIFMLCETEEQGQLKCESYWPRNKGGSMEIAGFLIKNVEVDTSDSTTILCYLEVTTKTDKYTLKHHQWRTWPDKSVPQSVMAPFRLLRVSRWAHTPTIIHCSAGIGRTGTVAALEYCLQTLLTCKPLNVVQCIQHMRNMRLQVVQTDLQLLYIHKCLIAYASAAGLLQGELLKKAAKFEADYNEALKQKAKGESQPAAEPAARAPGVATPQISSPNIEPKSSPILHP